MGREIWFCSQLVSTLRSGDACPWPYSLWCLLPEAKLGPRGFDLVIGDLPAGFSRCGIDPVGETSKRPRYPSWLASPCGFTTCIYELDISMLVASVNRSSLSPSHDRLVATHNAAETTPRASNSDAGGLGEVCALSRTPTGGVHGEGIERYVFSCNDLTGS